jgi:broad specificity phosphatase PhoE
MEIRLMRRVLVALLFLSLAAPATSVLAQDDVVVYLVRHAERAEDGTEDPPISEAGEMRARLIARMLQNAGITDIYSTNYQRTRATAEPTAARLGIEVQPYAPRDLAAFARQLLETPGRHLVVGHSNTTPALVRELGGDPGEPIDESEYDRLYIVVADGDGVSTVLLRFGVPFPG